MKRRRFIQTMAVAVPAAPTLANNSQLAEIVTSGNFQLTQPTTRPSVQITFDGLLLFAFEKDNSQCVIGTAKCANHRLKIIVDGREVIESSAKNISIFSDLREGVTQHRSSSVPSTFLPENSNDLGWLMAIQGAQFHNDPNLPKNLDAIEQRIAVKTGTFYTAATASDALIIAPNGSKTPTTIATQVGCNIALQQGETLAIVLDGWRRTFTHQEAIQKIEFKYLCESPVSPDHGDFRAFYAIYDTVREADQFDVISSIKLQSLTGLKTQSDGPRDFCPPIEGEPPV